MMEVKLDYFSLEASKQLDIEPLLVTELFLNRALDLQFCVALRALTLLIIIIVINIFKSKRYT